VETGIQTVMLPTLPELWAAKDAPAAAIQTVPSPDPEVAPKPTEPSTAPEPPARSVITRPVDGAVSADYSMEQLRYNETTKDWRTHAGMDIAAPEGSDVVAAADGKVLAVYEDDLLGQTVTVEHAGGVVTHYANLAEDPAVSAGDEVKSGDLLGKVGRTALVELADEPHLHFAVYRNNVPQDPEAFLG
jgi:murein DD-endopeptidase MepM/ murein hydrolase activator NlpD